jgi:hypothetical protein
LATPWGPIGCGCICEEHASVFRDWQTQTKVTFKRKS